MKSKPETIIVEVEAFPETLARAERFLKAMESGQPFFRAADQAAAFDLLKHLIAESKIIHE